MKKWFLLLLSVVSFLSHGQEVQDSTFAKVGVGYIQSNQDFLPFFLEHNRWGAIDSEQTLFVSGEVFYNKKLKGKWQLSTGANFRNDRLNTYFLTGTYDFIDLTFGAKKRIIGGIESDLSMINYGLGRNARPAPMIELKMNKYYDVPFTEGIVKFKANIAHRWLEKERFQSQALMHSKDLYVLFDFKKIGFQVGTGLVHFAQFGGTSNTGIVQPSDFNTFLDVFFGRGAGEGEGTIGENNARGNHLGMHEISFKKWIGEHELTLDYQSPFEDGGSMQYISLKNFLLALNWKPNGSISWLDEMQIEYTQTLRQSGPGLPDPTPNFPDEDANFGHEFGGRDDYHNNYLYRSGFTYKSLIMGNPLFLTYDWTQNFLAPYENYGVTVSSNRIKAWVFSLKGSTGDDLNYQIQYVRSHHFGSYKGLYDGRFNWGGIQLDPNYDYPFWPSKVQHFSLVTLAHEEPFDLKNIRISALIAFDTGELYTNTGIEFGVDFILNSR